MFRGVLFFISLSVNQLLYDLQNEIIGVSNRNVWMRFPKNVIFTSNI